MPRITKEEAIKLATETLEFDDDFVWLSIERLSQMSIGELREAIKNYKDDNLIILSNDSGEFF